MIVPFRSVRNLFGQADEQSLRALMSELMKARSAVRSAKLAGSQINEAAAHRAVGAIKRELGECGPVWWMDGAPDLNRHAAKRIPCAK